MPATSPIDYEKARRGLSILVTLGIGSITSAQPQVLTKRTFEIELYKGTPRWIYFTAADKEFVTITNRGEIEYRDTKRGKALRRRNRHNYALKSGLIYTSVSYLPDGYPLRDAIPLQGGNFAFVSFRNTLELRATPPKGIPSSFGKAEIAGLDGKGPIGASPNRAFLATVLGPGTIYTEHGPQGHGNNDIGLFDQQLRPIRRKTTVKAWNQELRTDPIRPVRHVAVSNPGTALAICGTQLWRCDLKNNRWDFTPILTDASKVTQVGFLRGNRLLIMNAGRLLGIPGQHDGDRFAIANTAHTLALTHRSSIKTLSDKGTPILERQLPADLKFDHMAVTNDGRHVAGVTKTAIHLIGKNDHRVTPLHYAIGNSMSFTGDGRMVVLPRHDDFLVIDATTGTRRTTDTRLGLGRCLMAPYQNGTEFLVWSSRRGLHVLDATSGKVRRSFPKILIKEHRAVQSIHPSPDGNHIFLAFRNALAGIAHLDSGRTHWIDLDKPVRHVQWSEDSREVGIRLKNLDEPFRRVDIDGREEQMRTSPLPPTTLWLEAGQLLWREASKLRSKPFAKHARATALAPDLRRAAILTETSIGCTLSIHTIERR